MKEWLSENWPMLLAALGAGLSAFASLKGKKTPSEKTAAKITKMEKKVEKDLEKARADAEKLEELKKGGNTQ